MKGFHQIKKGLGLLWRFHQECLGQTKGKFYSLWIFHALFAALLITPPLIVRNVIDKGISENDISVVYLAAGLLFGVFSGVSIIDWFRHYWGHRLAQRITYQLRNNLYWHLQKLSFRFHDNIKVGELLSRLIDDLNRGEEVLYHAPQTWVTNLTMIVLTAVTLFILHAGLALIGIGIITLIGVVAFLVSRRMFGAEREVRKKKASMSAQAEDNLAGVRIIQSFVRECHEMDRFEQENRGHFHSRISAVYWWSWLFPGAVFILGVSLALVVAVGGRMAITAPEVMSVGTLTAFVMYLQRLMFPLLALFLINEQVIQYFTGVERYFRFMDSEPDIKDVPHAVSLNTVKGRVGFENVWFRYNEQEQPILRDINLNIEEGETVAFVGPSGTGKTTITRLVPRFYEPYSGRVTIDGYDVRNIKLSSLRQNIGLVMQDDYLFSESLINNVAYGRLDASREEIMEAAKQANIDKFVSDLPDGYDTNIGQRGVKVSEGQAQRISIARAIVKNPPILILDEATSSVDSETELLIQEALARVMEDKTCFVIAHRLSTVVNADRICFIKDGCIAEEGKHDELMAKDGYYAYYFNLQAQGTNAGFVSE